MRHVIVVMTVVLLSLAGAQAASASGWANDQVPLLMGPQGELDGITCPAGSSSCVAVGATQTAHGGATVPLVESWTGVQWSIETVQAPSTGADSQLVSVSCIPGQESSCIAVGFSGLAALIESRNASGWSVVSSPAISGATYASLRSVSCTSPTACVAVGFAGTPSGETPLSETWDGTSWSVQSVPLPAGYGVGGLTGVSCTSAGCEAVGFAERGASNSQSVPLVARWDGSSWTDGSAQTPVDGSRGDLSGVRCSPGTLDCTAVGSYFANSGFSTLTLAEAGANGALVIEPTPNVTSTQGDNELAAIDCTAATACTAVGVGNTRNQTLVERWNGTDWSIQPSPDPTIGDYMRFLGVACPGVSSCVAVGGGPAGGASGGPDGTTLSESWDGTAWSIDPVPDTEPLSTKLAAVSCGSAADCMAVGTFIDLFGTERSFAERWDGASWTASQPPSGVASTELSGVSCPSPSSCLAVGVTGLSTSLSSPFAAMWNGASWVLSSPLFPPGASAAALNAVSCRSISDCVAVGTSTLGPLVEHFDGSAWSIEPDQLPAGQEGQLSGVSCPAAGDCTAVGEQDATSAQTPTVLVQHDTGSGWSTDPALGPAGGWLYAVDCIATNFCYAVGQNGVDVTLVEWWDGVTWIPIPAQNPGSVDELDGVSCAAASNCAAVGTFATTPSPDTTLAEQWNGTTWTTATTPNEADTPNILTSVSCPTTTTCISVGYSQTGYGFFFNNIPIVQQYTAPPDTTPPPPPTTTSPPAGSTPPPQNIAAPTVTIGAHAAVSGTGVADVTLRCSADTGARCIGQLTLTASIKPKLKNHVEIKLRTVKLGSAPYNTAAGKLMSVKVRLTKAGATLLDAAHDHRLTAKASTRPTGGTELTKTVTLTAPAPKKSKK